jgi:Family of unknown function (DUF6644)
MLFQFMGWLEESLLGHLMRDTGVWTYAVVNLAHILGVSVLFGSILILDLRLLGAWQGIPLATMSRPIVQMAAAGFAVAAVTGAGLLATKATEYVGNPFLYAKFPAIALGLLNVLVIHRSAAWKAHAVRELSAPERTMLARLGGTSLMCWLTAISAGRMIAYW